MCRLLALAAPTERPLADVLGADQLAAFCAMARLHDDGWGAAWLRADGAVDAERSPRSGAEDPALPALLARTRTRGALLHLRLASDGMARTTENSHPFLVDGVALAHNGAAVPADRMLPLLRPAERARLRGTTDSERYAALVRGRAAGGLPLPEAAASAAADLAALYPASSLNAVLLSAGELVVVHASEGARVPHEDFDASGLAEEELPIGHRTGYYQLWRRRGADGSVAFSSSGLPTDGWEALAPRTVVAVDLATLQQREVPVARAGVEAVAVRA